jgi:hypothetical protein
MDLVFRRPSITLPHTASHTPHAIQPPALPSILSFPSPTRPAPNPSVRLQGARYPPHQAPSMQNGPASRRTRQQSSTQPLLCRGTGQQPAPVVQRHGAAARPCCAEARGSSRPLLCRGTGQQPAPVVQRHGAAAGPCCAEARGSSPNAIGPAERGPQPAGSRASVSATRPKAAEREDRPGIPALKRDPDPQRCYESRQALGVQGSSSSRPCRQACLPPSGLPADGYG